ncbi:MAG: NAD(P)/FAD-dependent oxidoreductase [Myxococcota bacterium]|nr:NAD(P)/FAD-dependent oxidoreductase [Myxococcota bacterium]
MSTEPHLNRPLRSVRPASEGPPVPLQEDQRRDAVTALNQLHTENQPALIALRNTAQALLRTPVAFISFIEDETQRLLTVCVVPKERGEPVSSVEFKEFITPRDCSICQYTIMEKDHLVIPNLKAFLSGDHGQHYPEVFRKQAAEVGGYPIPWPTPEGGLEMRPAHFYAGATIRTKSGMHVGTFCVIDVIPRPDFGIREVEILESLAAQAAQYMEERALLHRPANLQLLKQSQQREITAQIPEGEETVEVDTVVLGAGPAGTTAACRLAFQGLKVALVEPKTSFGAPTGVNSKVLREVAKEYGAATTWESVLQIRDLIARQDAARVATQLKRYGVSLMRGRGRIEGLCADAQSTQVYVTHESGEETRIKAKAVVLSTGSKARRLPNIPFDQEGVYDSDSISKLTRKPRSLFIQGTGIIALEYATIFAKMGVNVTLSSRGGRESFLPALDSALRDALVSDLETMGVEVLYQCNVRSWRSESNGVHLTLSDPSGEQVREFEAVMSAIGRVPVLGKLGLETVYQADATKGIKNLKTDPQHRVDADAALVYAVGDVSGSGLACQAVVQAQEVVDALLPQLLHHQTLGGSLPSTTPSRAGSASVIWAIPELAFVGQSEEEAKENFGPAQVTTVVAPFADTIRGSLNTLPESHFLKLVCLRHDGRIVGVHIYGEGASELIHLAASLVADGETVFKLQYRTFPAVTLHEVYRNAAMHAIDTLSLLAMESGERLT